MKTQSIARNLQLETTVSNLVGATHTLGVKYLEHSSQLRELHEIAKNCVSKTELHAAVGSLAYKYSGDTPQSEKLQELLREKYDEQVKPIAVTKRENETSSNNTETTTQPIKRIVPNENYVRFDRKVKMLEEMILHERQQSNTTIQKLSKDVEDLQTTVQHLTVSLKEALSSISQPEQNRTPEKRIETLQASVSLPSEQNVEEEETIIIPPVRRPRRALLKQHTAPPVVQDDATKKEELSSVSLAMRYMRQPSLPISTKELEAVKSEKDEYKDTTLLSPTLASAETEEKARIEQQGNNVVDTKPEMKSTEQKTHLEQNASSVVDTKPEMIENPRFESNQGHAANDTATPAIETHHVDDDVSAIIDTIIDTIIDMCITSVHGTACDAKFENDSLGVNVTSAAVIESTSNDLRDSIQDDTTPTDTPPGATSVRIPESCTDDMNDSITSDGGGSVNEDRSEDADLFDQLRNEQTASGDVTACPDEASHYINEATSDDTTQLSSSEAGVQVDLPSTLVRDNTSTQLVPSLGVKSSTALSQSVVQSMIDARVAMQIRDIKASLQSLNKTISAQGTVIDHFQQRINSSLSMATDAASKYTWLSESLSILNHDYNVLYKSVNELHTQSQSTEYSIYSMINNVIGVVDNIVLKLDKQRDIDDVPVAGTLDAGIHAMVKELEEKVNNVFVLLQKNNVSATAVPMVPSINTTGATVQESNHQEEIQTLLREMRKHESEMRMHAADYKHVVAEHKRILDELSKRPLSSPTATMPTPVMKVSVSQRPVTSASERTSPIQKEARTQLAHATASAKPASWKLDAPSPDIAALRRDMDNLKSLMLKNMLTGNVARAQAAKEPAAIHQARYQAPQSRTVDVHEDKKERKATRGVERAVKTQRIDAGVMLSAHPSIPLHMTSVASRKSNQTVDDSIAAATSVSSSVPVLSVNNLPTPQPPTVPKRSNYQPHYLSLASHTPQARSKSNLEKLLGDGNFEMASIEPPLRHRRSNTASTHTRKKRDKYDTARARTAGFEASASCSDAEDAFITSVFGAAENDGAEEKDTKQEDDKWFREIGHTIPSEPYSVLIGGSSTAWHNPFGEVESSFVSDLS